MTEPRWDLIHDAVIADDEPEYCKHIDPDPDRGHECGCTDDLERQAWLDEQDAWGSDCA